MDVEWKYVYLTIIPDCKPVQFFFQKYVFMIPAWLNL